VIWDALKRQVVWRLIARPILTEQRHLFFDNTRKPRDLLAESGTQQSLDRAPPVTAL
jgi:hypothetical protein